MNTRFFLRIYGAILIGVTVIVLVVWGWNYQVNLSAPDVRADDDFSYVLQNTHPELYSSSNQPIFTIKDVKKPTNNWYVLKLALREGTGPESFIIINDPHFGNEYMSVIAGPESKFSRQGLLKTGVLIPSAVIDTLRGEGAL